MTFAHADRKSILAAPRPSHLIFLALSYSAFYGWLLSKSSGFPYVFDNNESFSAFWHAVNMYHFGVERTFGLTDEAFGFSEGAHPYVYTHQGNFPRFLALVLYSLGARSIESQIVVTTFTVGIAATYLAYRFFCQLTGSCSFALLACTIIFSDYLLVAQWQMVTFRVWHGLFFFSTLLCIHALEGSNRRLAGALLFGNTVCLFYFELIFAGFLAAFGTLYALIRNYRRFKHVALVGLLLLAGGVTGAGVLCGQIVLYMGWNNFVQDVVYTFVSRNQDSASEATRVLVTEFYESNRVVFWHNFFDASGFRTPQHLIASVVRYELQPHTPFFIQLLLLPVAGYLTSRAGPVNGAGIWLNENWLQPLLSRLTFWDRTASRQIESITELLKRYFKVVVLALLATLWIGAYLIHQVGRGEFSSLEVLGVVAVLLSSFIGIVATRMYGLSIARATSLAATLALLGFLPSVAQHIPLMHPQMKLVAAQLIVLSGAYAVILLAGVHLATIRPSSADELTAEGWKYRHALEMMMFVVTSLVVLMMCSGDTFALHRVLADMQEARLDLGNALIGTVGVFAGYAALVRSFSVGGTGWQRWMVPGVEAFAAIDRAWRFNIFVAAIIVGHSFLYNQAYELVWQAVLREIAPEPVLRGAMLCAVLVAHAFVQTGYLGVRFASPSRLLPGVGAFFAAGYLAYAVVYFVSPGYVFTGYRFRFTPFTAFLTDTVVACCIYFALRGLTLLCTTTGIRPVWGLAAGSVPLLFWLLLQGAHVSLVPPDQFTVLRKTLSATPYVGASFVSNSYTAPLAAFTGHWAYIDEELSKAKAIEADGARRLETGDKYLWFADRATNPEYKRPEYFLCILPQSFPSLAAKVRHDRGEGRRYRGCAEMGIVKYALSGGAGAWPHARLVAIDQDGPTKVGYETWAIVKLDWGP